jgi:hypothetical protein
VKTRFNTESHNIYKENYTNDIYKDWLLYTIGGSGPSKKIFVATGKGRRHRGRQRFKWVDDEVFFIKRSLKGSEKGPFA